MHSLHYIALGTIDLFFAWVVRRAHRRMPSRTDFYSVRKFGEQ